MAGNRLNIGLSGETASQPWMERNVLSDQLALEVVAGKELSLPDNVRDIPRPEGWESPFSGSLNGGTSFSLIPPFNPEAPCLASPFSREFTIPLKSWHVVKSGARSGGFWFHSSCSRVSSVREGQFIVMQCSILLFGYLDI